MHPEFILVTGANATGKTTLIESNRSELEVAGFQIIIPDNILKYATSHTDAPAVIQEFIDDALSQNSNFVLESPFQFESLIKTLDQIEQAGYDMSIYQLFVADVDESIGRVKDRYDAGGYFIPSDQVTTNFDANFKHVAHQFSRFDHAHFIDSSKGMKLAAEFKRDVLLQFRSSTHKYLKKLFGHACLQNKIKKDALKIVLANKNYPGATGRKQRRLKY